MQVIEIVPSLLSADFANLAREIKKVESAGFLRDYSRNPYSTSGEDNG